MTELTKLTELERLRLQISELERLRLQRAVVNKQNQLEKAVENALRGKVAASAAYDNSSAAFLKAEAAVIQDEKTYYKSDDVLEKAQLALSNFLKEQDNE